MDYTHSIKDLLCHELLNITGINFGVFHLLIGRMIDRQELIQSNEIYGSDHINRISIFTYIFTELREAYLVLTSTSREL